MYYSCYVKIIQVTWNVEIAHNNPCNNVFTEAKSKKYNSWKFASNPSQSQSHSYL